MWKWCLYLWIQVHTFRVNTKTTTDDSEARSSEIIMNQVTKYQNGGKHTEREQEHSHLNQKVTKHTLTCRRWMFKSIKE